MRSLALSLFGAIFATQALAANFEWVETAFCPKNLAPPPLAAIRQLVELQPLFSEAIQAIRSGDEALKAATASQMVRRQAEYLQETSVDYRIGGDGKWIDILPNPKGAELNRYADRLEKETPGKGILRYDPRALLGDSQSVFEAVPPQVIYLTTRDLVAGPRSYFFQEQAARYVAAQAKAERLEFLRPQETQAARREIDFHSQPKPAEGWGYPTSREYLEKKTPPLALIPDREDPYAVLFGPYRRSGYTGQFEKQMQTDFTGLRLVEEIQGPVRKYRLEDPANLLNSENAKPFALNLFLERLLSDDRYVLEGTTPDLVRQISLPNGETLYQVSGALVPKAVFERYLAFLSEIYRSYPDLRIDESLMNEIRQASLALLKKSELVAWTKGPTWLEDPKAEEILSGLIFVRSESAGDRLPLEWIRRLPAGSLREDGADDILVEVGRLGSLSTWETIRLLKGVASELDRRYGRTGRKIRVFCEANGIREKYFGKFGFKRSKSKVTGMNFYASGEDHLLETDLQGFLKAVMK